jgi:hypothetical protein
MNRTTQLLELCEALVNAESKEELTTLKAKSDKSLVKEAWEMLDDSIKKRIKAICSQPEPPKTEETPKPNWTDSNKLSNPQNPTPKLWELSSEIEQLEDAIAEILDQDELSDEEREQQLELIFSQWLLADNNFDKKAISVAHFIKHLEALAEARKTEYRRLRNLAEQSDKQAERLRYYLASNLVKLNKKRIQGVAATVSLRKNPVKVILNCEPEQLPPEFQRVTVEPRLTAIKDYLKTHTCEFATLSTEEKYSIMIK